MSYFFKRYLWEKCFDVFLILMNVLSIISGFSVLGTWDGLFQSHPPATYVIWAFSAALPALLIFQCVWLWKGYVPFRRCVRSTIKDAWKLKSFREQVANLVHFTSSHNLKGYVGASANELWLAAVRELNKGTSPEALAREVEDVLKIGGCKKGKIKITCGCNYAPNKGGCYVNVGYMPFGSSSYVNFGKYIWP